MKYIKELLVRIVIAVLLLVIPVNIFYLLFSKVTLFGSLSIFYLLGYPIHVNGYNLSINGQGLEFVPACVATSAYYLLALLVLLTKDIKLKDRFYIFVSGGLLILLMNLIRIDILIYLLVEFGKNWFESVHIIFWHFVSSIYVVAVWIFLTYKFKIKSVPVYSDFKFLLFKSVFRKKVRKRSK
jgi:exosortase/archaeosortase family protein